MTGQNCVCWAVRMASRSAARTVGRVCRLEQAQFQVQCPMVISSKPFGINGVGGGIRTLGHWNHKTAIGSLPGVRF